ncbi:MAG: sodium:solute symporter, partial [Pseudomonadota bacterium]|nr:sodium:solute symporter [Pseudomonadota bacterium]
GIIAAALSTLNSGLNSMSSVLIQDLYRPWQRKRGQQRSEHHFVNAGRVAMAVVALALASMACLCYYWQQYSDTPLLQFALGVMVFSYSGLLGVYFITLFTQRGSPASVTAALLCGFIIPLLLQPYVMSWYLPEAWQLSLGFTWQLVIGTLVATLVCAAGRQPEYMPEKKAEAK